MHKRAGCHSAAVSVWPRKLALTPREQAWLNAFVKYRLVRACLALSMLAALGAPAGCGDGTNKVAVPQGNGESVIVTLSVAPDPATRVVGQTQSFSASATDDKGHTSDVTRNVTWTSSDVAIATIGKGTGVATARSPGTVVITARWSKVVATASFIVTLETGVGAGGAAGEPALGGGAPGAAGTPEMSGGAAGSSEMSGGAAGAPSNPGAVTRIYVSSLGGEGIAPNIRIFELDADGDAAPVASFMGAATTLKGPSQMAVAGNELFVANGEGKSILVFDLDVPGNVAPVRTISGANTTFSNFSPMGLALRGSSILVSDQSKGLLTFPTNGAGDIAPSAQIGPTFFYAAHVSSSPVASEVLVAVPNPSEVRGYLQTAGVTDVPLRVLKPDRTWARGVTSTPTGIFVVTAGLVGATVDDAITVFAHDAQTDASPLRAIVGLSKTGLHDPHGISVHAGEVYVANQSEHAVRVFDESADGDVDPVRIIKGAATGLRFPAGVLIATTGG